ncbi:MAG TPA: hypothetical protein VFD55_00610 [Candidatus Angelobacter sp.]|nr:hypothetical protein [Candidatus Angelobacter sp.]
MKKIIKESLKQLVADRYLLVLVSALVLLALSFAITIGLSIRPSELQLVSHYSAFGVTHFYFDQWFYLLVFVAFGIIVAVLHVIIAIKLLITKGKSFAAMFVWFGIGIILLSWVTALSVLNVWTPL